MVNPSAICGTYDRIVIPKCGDHRGRVTARLFLALDQHLLLMASKLSVGSGYQEFIGEAMTPAQARAARALIDMNQTKLAEVAGLGLSTVVDFERDRRVVSPEAVTAIQHALEAAGVEFTNGGQPGVRMKTPHDTVADVSDQIELLEAKSSNIPSPGRPSPESSMNIMKKAVIENELVRLRNKRKHLKHRDNPGGAR